ncbi:N-acetylglucosamine kinase [Arthrobacter silvisoli]|uniref:N-acetylglucosamine kinase n=1 Tax=Arthrobacter silvisoli TaxID=2291022 RepID=UPI000E213CE4|nr:BadF/BadG/BcrA/BcrD ATPase family protein [Arthrobacter silvisoli]
MNASEMVLVADLGKSRCRLELRSGDRVLAQADQHGFPGLGITDGARLAFELLEETAAMIPAELTASGPSGSPLAGFGAAVAGVEASAESSSELAALLSRRFHVPAAVLSDATAAQLGAMQGAPGTVLIVGTGAVAFRFDDGGQLHRADGWGPLLGDRGSGRWIGQRGLEAVVQAFDGGPETSLSAAAGALVETPLLLPAWLGGSKNPYRSMANFAPLVLHAAQAGDAVARRIVDEACTILAGTVTRANGGHGRVAVLGGLASSVYFAGLLHNTLASAGMEMVEPLGDGMDGAALAATRRGLLQERYIHRDGTNWPD